MTHTKKIAILQSNYIPWKGYFDLINMVDEFILYDDMQYTRRDWRNRNKIKASQGLQWLTIPVEVKGKYLQAIKETKISEADWGKKHWQSIRLNYLKAPYFQQYKDVFEALYLDCNLLYLSEINFCFLQTINQILGITTPLRWSSEFDLIDGKSERLLGICKDCKATEYISGPTAKNYMNETLFEQENIRVSWIDYRGYPEYNQLFPPFEHGVSILDLIFNEGPDASKFMKSFERTK